jgi:hypothetical protein
MFYSYILDHINKPFQIMYMYVSSGQSVLLNVQVKTHIKAYQLIHKYYIQIASLFFFYFVHTTHATSRPSTYGGHGREPQRASTYVNSAPSLFSYPWGSLSGLASTHTYSEADGWFQYPDIRYPLYSRCQVG